MSEEIINSERLTFEEWMERIGYSLNDFDKPSELGKFADKYGNYVHDLANGIKKSRGESRPH